MKQAANKMISPVYWTGLFVSISGLIWLGIYYTVAPAEAMLIMGSVLACIALQTAAWLGGRKFQNATFWPGLCMLAAGPATLWGAFAGPGALYGISAEILDYTRWDDLPPLYYVAIPVMVVGILVCIAFVLVGLLSLSADLAGLGDKKEQKRRRQRLMAMQPTAGEAPGNEGKTRVIAKREQRRELARATAQQPEGETEAAVPDGATRYIPTEVDAPGAESARAAAGEAGAGSADEVPAPMSADGPQDAKPADAPPSEPVVDATPMGSMDAQDTQDAEAEAAERYQRGETLLGETEGSEIEDLPTEAETYDAGAPVSSPKAPEATAPVGGSLLPEAEALAPEAETLETGTPIPLPVAPEATAPVGETLLPEAEALAPEDETPASGIDAPDPKTEALSPKNEAPAPKAKAATRKAKTKTPKTKTPAPQADAPTDTDIAATGLAAPLPPHTIPVRPNVAPRWTPVRPARPRAGLVNPTPTAPAPGSAPAGPAAPGDIPEDLFAAASPRARMTTRLESITQTLRLSAIREAAGDAEDAAAAEPE